jgi:hypothetical protein
MLWYSCWPGKKAKPGGTFGNLDAIVEGIRSLDKRQSQRNQKKYRNFDMRLTKRGPDPWILGG